MQNFALTQRRPPWVAVLLAAALVAGCSDENKPRLYKFHDLPPAGLVADVPISMVSEVQEGTRKVELSEANIAAMKHMGATLVEAKDGSFRGVNFAVFSQRAEKMRLLLFDDPESSRATREFDMARFGDVWNVFVEGVGLGQHYGFIAWGPNWVYDENWYPGSIHGFVADVDHAGNRFNPNKLLFDPYCKAFHRDHDWGKGSLGTGPHRIQSTFAAAMKCVVVKSEYQWSEEEKDYRAKRQTDDFEGHRWNDVILYEVHAKGFTANSSSGVAHPGTYRGFGEKAAYLKDLGVTAVELMPPYEKPLDGGYWGYNTLSFFAPELSYASRRRNAEVIDEFKWMVDELHKHGIEVILDVVYNHSGEGGLWREKIFPSHAERPYNLDPEETASLFSYRGLDNANYYALPPDTNRQYCDYTGVGNTMRCNTPVMRRLILDSLRYWVEEFHVDGYRFDLAPALGAKDGAYDGCPTSQRGGGGVQWDPTNTVLQEIVDDPYLQKMNTRIIAEPWGGGHYAIGQFPASTTRPGYGWGEWNNRFRDWWRSFIADDNWKFNSKQDGGDGGYVMTGSEGAYGWNGRRPYHSANFITVHDGMTMYDLVTYPKKVNGCSPLNPVCCSSPMSPFCWEAENSGTDDNRSRNWGSEEMKRQIMRNFFAAMLVSHGTPLLFGGDEWMRTQLGNNNTYTPEADNPASWHDWGAWEAKDDRHRMHDFVKELVRLRKEHAYAFAPAEYGNGAPFSWKNAANGDPAWDSRNMMIHYYDSTKGPELVVLINMQDHDVPFTLPAGRFWRRLLDTQQAFDTPAYLNENKLPLRKSANVSLDNPETMPATYSVKSRTIVVMEAAR